MSMLFVPVRIRKGTQFCTVRNHSTLHTCMCVANAWWPLINSCVCTCTVYSMLILWKRPSPAMCIVLEMAQLSNGIHAECKASQVTEVDRKYAEENLFKYWNDDFNNAVVPSPEECTLLCKNKFFVTPRSFGGQCIGFRYSSGSCQLLFRDSGDPSYTHPLDSQDFECGYQYYSIADCL
jgi:hypothetical protein